MALQLNRRRLLQLAGAFLAAAPAAGRAAEPVIGLAPLARTMEGLCASQPGIAGALVVAFGGRLVLAQGYGGAAADRPFLLASTAKCITAAAIATLIQDGRLRLESQVGEVLSGLFASDGEPGDARVRGISVLQLLTHTSGLPTTDEADPTLGSTLLHLLASRPPERLSKRDLFRNALDRPLQAAPGSGYRYSNLGYLYLGLIVEAVSGWTYEDYCQHRVLRPAGVTRGRVPDELRFADAFGGWSMPAPDLLKLLQIFEPGNDAVLGPDFHRFLTHPSAARLRLPDGRAASYTLGFYLRTDNAMPLWWHPGEIEFHSPALNLSAGALVAHGDMGATWVAMFSPRLQHDPATTGEITFLAAARQVSRWPSSDLFPQFDLPAAPP